MNLETNENPQNVWYYIKQGSRIGPVSFDQIKQLSASGGLLPDDWIWRPGLEQWAPAREIPGLFPPLPHFPVANYHTVNEENVNSVTSSTLTAIPDKPAALNLDGRKSRGWLVVLLLLCLVILAYGFFYSKNSTNNLAYLIGYNLPSGLIIWGIFYAFLGRKQGRKLSGLSFVAIYFSLLVSDFIGYTRQKNAAIQAATEIQKEFSTFANSITDSKGAPQRIERIVDVSPKAKGEFGEMERFIKTFMNKMASNRNDYLLELDAIGWEKILDPGRMKADKTLIESKVMTQKAKEIVIKYREKTDVLLENARKDINSLNLSENSRSEMLRGFDNSMEKSKHRIDEMWNLEARVISEFENIFALLSEKKKSWAISNEQIIFYNNDALNRYNAYLESVQNIVQQQEAIQKQSIEASNEFFNKLKQ
ncbi:MAG TPA: DUF4339 domain-containing protein [Blastocatellia bacterium]|nr:DUF4339 domain-containing protein [Blastocatellia bacterium]